MTEAAVRALRPDDEEAWRTLWAGYLAFYRAEVSAEVTVSTWQRLIGGREDVGGFAAVDEHDVPVGFAHYVVHLTNWDTRPVGYLEDLFVAAEHRGRALGRKLIERLAQHGSDHDWAEIHWITEANNQPARRLYRSLASETDWVRYEIALRDTAR